MNRKQLSDRKVNSEELRALGFDENEIREAVTDASRGIFAVSPPQEVIEQVLEKCRPVLESAKK